MYSGPINKLVKLKKERNINLIVITGFILLTSLYNKVRNRLVLPISNIKQEGSI